MKLSLAPIQGTTFAFYRNLYNEIFGGIDEYYSPFITTTDERSFSPKYFKDILPEVNSDDIKLIPQLLSNNGDDFSDFASRIVDMGYKEINWNIGCPFPMVTRKKRGSGVLPHPDMIREFLDIVCKDDSYDLTVKMRLGLKELEEGIKVIDILNDYPISDVIIHGRTGAQRYEGTVDLDAFETLYKASKHEVTYNGDIFTVDDFNRVQERFPDINNFMLARGALSNPFLASNIKGHIISTDEKLLKIKEFHDGIYDNYGNILSGDKHLIDRMKEFWLYIATNLENSDKFVKKIKKCKSSTEYDILVNQVLSTSSGWKDSF